MGLYITLLASMYCAYTDFKKYIIPDIVTIPVLVGGMFFHATLGNGIFFSLKGLIIGLVFIGLAVLTKQITGTRQVGGGDGKLLMAIGSWLGWLPVLIITCIALLLAGIWALILIIQKQKHPIPFAVCIFPAVLLFGAIILWLRSEYVWM